MMGIYEKSGQKAAAYSNNGLSSPESMFSDGTSSIPSV
jgi:hypothetical protein